MQQQTKIALLFADYTIRTIGSRYFDTANLHQIRSNVTVWAAFYKIHHIATINGIQTHKISAHTQPAKKEDLLRFVAYYAANTLANALALPIKSRTQHSFELWYNTLSALMTLPAINITRAAHANNLVVSYAADRNVMDAEKYWAAMR